MSTMYGEKLTRAKMTAIFGDTTDADDRRGIVQRGGKVAWILVKVGATQTYPNEVTAEHVKYCYASKDGRANQAMKKAFEEGSTFHVKVVPDGGVDTYLWGSGKISVLQEDHIHNGRNYRRWVIHRTSKRTAEEMETVVPQVPTQVPTEPVPSLDDDGKTAAMRLCLEGQEFDSLLEKRHAAMMTTLGIPWRRECVTYHNVVLGSGRIASYTPDFTIDIDRGVYVQTYVVEIKPCYPYDDEIRKCFAACERMKTTPIILLYNTGFHNPFAKAKEGDGQGSYLHHTGIRGMKFSWNPLAKKVTVEHDVSYCILSLSNGKWIGDLDVRASVDDERFFHPALDEAYSLAATV